MDQNRGKSDFNLVSKKTRICIPKEKFEEFTAVYEYTLDEISEKWSFKVGKLGEQKRVEFSNGINVDGLLRHMRIDKKINPKTVIRYL